MRRRSAVWLGIKLLVLLAAQAWVLLLWVRSHGWDERMFFQRETRDRTIRLQCFSERGSLGMTCQTIGFENANSGKLPARYWRGISRHDTTSGVAAFDQTPLYGASGFRRSWFRFGFILEGGAAPQRPGAPWPAIASWTMASSSYALIMVPHWFVIALVAVFEAVVVINSRRASEADRTYRCAHCGYDLRATPDRCPECGAIPPPRAGETIAARSLVSGPDLCERH